MFKFRRNKKRLCITNPSKEQKKLKQFIDRFGTYYRYYCPKKVNSIKPLNALMEGYKTNHFVDIRPKDHKVSKEFKELIIDNIKGNNKEFYKSINLLHSDTIIYSLFNGFDMVKRNGLFTIKITSYNPFVVDLVHPIQKKIPYNGSRICVHVASVTKESNHSMGLIQDKDGTIYFFNPNGSSDRDTLAITHTHKKKILDLFEYKGPNEHIYNCFPNFTIYANKRKKNIFTNNYGLCYSISKYFMMVATLNDTVSMSNIIYYICCKFSYYFCKSLSLKFGDFKKQLDTLFVKMNRPLDIEEIIFNVNHDVDTTINIVDDTWTETIYAFYLFILETHLVFIASLLEWSYGNNKYIHGSVFDNFLSLQNNSVILENVYQLDIYGKYRILFNDCSYTGDKKQCIIDNFKNGFITGYLNYIGNYNIYEYRHIIKQYLPRTLELLNSLGYDIFSDVPYKNTRGYLRYNKGLMELLLNTEIDMEDDEFTLDP